MKTPVSSCNLFSSQDLCELIRDVQISRDFRCKMARITVNRNNNTYIKIHVVSQNQAQVHLPLPFRHAIYTGMKSWCVNLHGVYNDIHRLCCEVLLVPCSKFHRQLIIKFLNFVPHKTNIFIVDICTCFYKSSIKI